MLVVLVSAIVVRHAAVRRERTAPTMAIVGGVASGGNVGRGEEGGGDVGGGEEGGGDVGGATVREPQSNSHVRTGNMVGLTGIVKN